MSLRDLTTTSPNGEWGRNCRIFSGAFLCAALRKGYSMVCDMDSCGDDNWSWHYPGELWVSFRVGDITKKGRPGICATMHPFGLQIPRYWRCLLHADRYEKQRKKVQKLRISLWILPSLD